MDKKTTKHLIFSLLLCAKKWSIPHLLRWLKSTKHLQIELINRHYVLVSQTEAERLSNARVNVHEKNDFTQTPSWNKLFHNLVILDNGIEFGC